MAASPCPYAEPSLATEVQFGARMFWMYGTAPFASSLLFPTQRNQWVQPWVARASSVADGVMNGMPAWSNRSPTAADSPENAGPMMPTTEESLTTLSARGEAWSPLPPVSWPSMVIFTGSLPNLPATSAVTATRASTRSMTFLLLRNRLLLSIPRLDAGVVYHTRPRKASEVVEEDLPVQDGPLCRQNPKPVVRGPAPYRLAPLSGTLMRAFPPPSRDSLPGGDLGEKLPEETILLFHQGRHPGPGVLGNPLDPAEVVRGHTKFPVGEGGFGHQRPHPRVLHDIPLEGELLVEDGDLR